MAGRSLRRNRRLAPAEPRVGPETGSDIGRKLVMTRAVREATIEAAERLGSDGKGKDGLVGYLIKMAVKRPDNFDTMLLRMIPLTLPNEGDKPGGVAQEFRTVEEVRRALKERSLPVPSSLMEGTPGLGDEKVSSVAEIVAEEISEEEFQSRKR